MMFCETDCRNKKNYSETDTKGHVQNYIVVSVAEPSKVGQHTIKPHGLIM